jgi:ABC-type branched-subunit amino acid transport system ATPase component
MGPAPILTVKDISLRFGGIVALDRVSFSMDEGQIVGLIGPNGAGKTTLFNCLSRLYTPDAGEIVFAGQTILAASPYRIADLGIGRTFQNLALFQTMTVLQNVMTGVHCQTRSDFLSNALRLPWVGREEGAMLGAYTRRDTARLTEDFDRVYRYFPVLRERRGQLAGTLSGGEQQMLAVARALMLRPRLLLLDEPSLGLAPLVVQEIFRIVRTINRQEQVSVLLVEQNASLALELADHAYLLETGRVVLAGPSGELRQDEAVRRSYLGY